MFFRGGSDDRSGAAVLFFVAALVLAALVSPALAQEGGSWSFVRRGPMVTEGATVYLSPPPVCTGRFATKEAAVDCLNNNRTWPLGWYTNKVGNTASDRSHLYGTIQESIVPVRISTAVCSAEFDGRECYQIVPTANGPLLLLLDSSGAPLPSNDRHLWFSNFQTGDSGSSCSGSCSSDVTAMRYPASGPSMNGIRFGVVYNANSPPDEEPLDGCVDEKWILKSTRGTIEDPEYDIAIGNTFEDRGCVWEWRPVGEMYPEYAGSIRQHPCTVPLNERATAPVLCVAKGLRKIDGISFQPDPNAGPLAITVGGTPSETDAMRVPDTWLQFFGWGSAIAPQVTATAAQLPVLGAMYQGIGQVSADEWGLIRLAAEGGYVDFALAPLDNNCTINEFYHPGNYTSTGKCLGAFDRDQGKKETYDPKDGFCWMGRACVTLDNPAASVVVIDSPVPPGTPSTPSETKVVTAESFELNGIDINYPPGVTDPYPNGGGSGDGGGGPVAPPGDGSVIGGFVRPEGTHDFGEGVPGSAEEASGTMSELLESAEGRLGFLQALEEFKVPVVTVTGPMCFVFHLGEITDGRFDGVINQCIPQWVWDLARFLVMLYAFLLAREIIWGH